MKLKLYLVEPSLVICTKERGINIFVMLKGQLFEMKIINVVQVKI